MIDLDTLREPKSEPFDRFCTVSLLYAPTFRVHNKLSKRTTNKVMAHCNYNLDLYELGMTFLEVLDTYLGGDRVIYYVYKTFVLYETNNPLFITQSEDCEFEDFGRLMDRRSDFILNLSFYDYFGPLGIIESFN